ncbi:hypothetical protein VTP01DRAFT_5756 [Rhizomucor pusillus]|uniref:uncharacterized protein n=1 Tax=Rhizomucor pusillus TaxID=4840 RepID=UPI003742538A
MARHEKKFNFEKDERVLCYHGPLLYEAKIIKRERKDDPNDDSPQYLVHYKGWKQTWDEWVPDERVLKWNDTNLQKQQQLKEMHSRRKPSRTSAAHTSTTEGSESRSRKRNRDASTEKSRIEEEMAKRAEFGVPMPESLKGRLVDDWENVTKNRQIGSLPRHPSVSEILQQFQASYRDKCNMSDEMLDQVIQGIELYFNESLATSLLYHQEQQQYEQMVHGKKTPSQVYGVEHFLRLFVEMPLLLCKANIDSETLLNLKECFSNILKFLQTEQSLQ